VTIGSQYEVSMLFVACYTMTWLMYHSRRLHRSPLSVMPASVSSRIPHTHIPDYIVGSRSSPRTEQTISVAEKNITIVYIFLLSVFLLQNVYTLMISQLPHVL